MDNNTENEVKTTENVIVDTVDNGTIENVHIAPIGMFYGSDAEGNPIPEYITEKSLRDIADKLNDNNVEVLADVDHGSSRAGLDRDTHAAGWFTKFIVDPIKGLFASLKLTKRGKELLENREYRFISPTFSLGEDGQPVQLHSASLTNTPAFAGCIDPILNQNAQPISEDKGKISMDITKEDLVALVKDIVKGMKEADEADDVKETIEETKEEKETVDNGCSEEAKEEVSNEATEEAKEEKVVEDEKDEVIKIESLNSTPVSPLASVCDKSWMNLHGKEFFDYLAKHPEIKG